MRTLKDYISSVNVDESINPLIVNVDGDLNKKELLSIIQAGFLEDNKYWAALVDEMERRISLKSDEFMPGTRVALNVITSLCEADERVIKDLLKTVHSGQLKNDVENSSDFGERMYYIFNTAFNKEVPNAEKEIKQKEDKNIQRKFKIFYSCGKQLLDELIKGFWQSDKLNDILTSKRNQYELDDFDRSRVENILDSAIATQEVLDEVAQLMRN